MHSTFALVRGAFACLVIDPLSPSRAAAPCIVRRSKNILHGRRRRCIEAADRRRNRSSCSLVSCSCTHRQALIPQKWPPVLRTEYAPIIGREHFLRLTGFHLAGNAPAAIAMHFAGQLSGRRIPLSSLCQVKWCESPRRLHIHGKTYPLI